jgi:hypothetical protein
MEQLQSYTYMTNGLLMVKYLHFSSWKQEALPQI